MFREQHTLTHEDWRAPGFAPFTAQSPRDDRLAPASGALTGLSPEASQRHRWVEGLSVVRGTVPWVQVVLCGWDVTLQ